MDKNLLPDKFTHCCILFCMKDGSCKWFIPFTFISPARCCLVNNSSFAWWHYLLLRPESFRVFLSCANYGFFHLNLAGNTKFKYEKKNEKDSGRCCKMTPSCKWPIHRNYKCHPPLPGNYDAEKVSIFQLKKSSNSSEKSCIFNAISECEAVQMLFWFSGI